MSQALEASQQTLQKYIAQINQYAMLTAGEERDLAYRLRDHNDVDAAERLVVANLRFVVKIAYEYRRFRASMPDLIQEGNIGLMHAVRRFDPDRGYRLISYAVHWIRAYIQAYIMKSWRLVKIGTTQLERKLFAKMGKLERLAGTGSREETDYALAQIASEADTSVDEVRAFRERLAAGEMSLNAPLGDGGRTVTDMVAIQEPTAEDVFAELEQKADLHARLTAALSNLPERDRHVIERRFLQEKPATLQEIGDGLGISAERVRQIEKRAASKLAGALGAQA